MAPAQKIFFLVGLIYSSRPRKNKNQKNPKKNFFAENGRPMAYLGGNLLNMVVQRVFFAGMKTTGVTTAPHRAE
jgi:hypothetical protein